MLIFHRMYPPRSNSSGLYKHTHCPSLWLCSLSTNQNKSPTHFPPKRKDGFFVIVRVCLLEALSRHTTPSVWVNGYISLAPCNFIPRVVVGPTSVREHILKGVPCVPHCPRGSNDPTQGMGKRAVQWIFMT
jgi:hypothetical protein